MLHPELHISHMLPVVSRLLHRVIVSEIFSMSVKSPASAAATALLFLTGTGAATSRGVGAVCVCVCYSPARSTRVVAPSSGSSVYGIDLSTTDGTDCYCVPGWY